MRWRYRANFRANGDVCLPWSPGLFGMSLENENAALQWAADAVCLEAVSELTVFGSRFWVQDLYPKKCLESKKLDSSWFLKYPVDPSKMMAIWRTCAPKKNTLFLQVFQKKTPSIGGCFSWSGWEFLNLANSETGIQSWKWGWNTVDGWNPTNHLGWC